MSDHHSMDTMHETHAEARSANLSRVTGPGALLAVIGFAILIFTFTQNQEQGFQSYLYGWISWLVLTLGCLGVTILHHTIRGSWGLSSLRLFEAGGGPVMIATMAVGFVPVALGAHSLYHWTHADAVKNDPILQHKAPYLNMDRWLIFAAAYFLIWLAYSYFMRKSALIQDRTGEIGEQHKRTNFGAIGLVIFVLTITLASTDWLMSLDPHWFSTIYGVWLLGGMALMAIAFATFIVCFNAERAPYNRIVTPMLTRDLGNLLLAFTMFWAYTSLSQFIITWSGNLPEFTSYYLNRQDGYWNILGGINVGLQFFLPFLLLLSPRVKATPRLLMMVAAWIFVMRFSDLAWNIIPFFDRGIMVSDIAALLGFGGLWLAIFGAQVRTAPLLPAHDRRLEEAYEAYHHEHA